MNPLTDLVSVSRSMNLFIREWGNGIAYPLCFAIFVVLSQYLYRAVRDNKGGWWNERGFDSAVSIYFLFIAEGLRSLSVWIPLRAANHGQKLSAWVEQVVSVMFVVSYALLLLVLLRCLYQFTPLPRSYRLLVVGLSLLGTAAILTIANL